MHTSYFGKQIHCNTLLTIHAEQDIHRVLDVKIFSLEKLLTFRINFNFVEIYTEYCFYQKVKFINCQLQFKFLGK